MFNTVFIIYFLEFGDKFNLLDIKSLHDFVRQNVLRADKDKSCSERHEDQTVWEYVIKHEVEKSSVEQTTTPHNIEITSHSTITIRKIALENSSHVTATKYLPNINLNTVNMQEDFLRRSCWVILL